MAKMQIRVGFDDLKKALLNNSESLTVTLIRKDKATLYGICWVDEGKDLYFKTPAGHQHKVLENDVEEFIIDY